MEELQALTLDEKRTLLDILENPQRISVLRKVYGWKAESWTALMNNEALSGEPNTNKIIQFAARADENMGFEGDLRRALERKQS